MGLDHRFGGGAVGGRPVGGDLGNVRLDPQQLLGGPVERVHLVRTLALLQLQAAHDAASLLAEQLPGAWLPHTGTGTDEGERWIVRGESWGQVFRDDEFGDRVCLESNGKLIAQWELGQARAFGLALLAAAGPVPDNDAGWWTRGNWRDGR